MFQQARRKAFFDSTVCIAQHAGQQADSGKPERANDAIKAKPQSSLLLVPVEAELADLKALLEREVPKQLWTINKPDQTCVASKGLDLGIATIKTPRIKCRIA